MKRTIPWLLALALLASLLLLLPMAAQATLPDTETCPNDPSGGTHDYVVTFEEPNCQHGLIERGTCSKCGKTYEFDYGQKGDHAFGDYEYFDPTCTEYGGTRRVCSVCGYVEELLEIEPLGHEEVGVPAKEATCTETGLTEGSKCSRCGIALTPQQTIPALGHDPVIVQGYGATCTAAGLTEGSKCSRCGAILTAQTEIPPLGHEFLKYSDKDATCTQAGERTWYCSRCTETKTETLPALGHAWGGWTQVSAATCTAMGSQARTCSRCGAQETQTIPALGHAWGSWAQVSAATCTAAGSQVHTCSSCGSQETQAIPALGHAAQAVSGYAATCTAAGLTDGSKCSRCGETLTAQAAIPALGHDYKLTASKEPTATEDGYKTYTCSRCQDTYTDVIPKVAHEHAYSVTAETPATCTASGSKTYTCSICGVAYSDTVPATGHNWSVWYTAQEATATQDGWMQRTCQNDPSHVEYQVIPATGEENINRDFTVTITVDPDEGKGKRYEGAVLSYRVEVKNTGNDIIYIPFDGESEGSVTKVHFGGNMYTDAVLLNPDEAFSFTTSVDKVHKEEVEEGVAHVSFGVFGVYTPDTDNPTQDTWWETIKYGKADIFLTYPETKQHDFTVTITVDPEEVKGKRYEGADLSFRVEVKNTGNDIIYIPFSGEAEGSVTIVHFGGNMYTDAVLLNPDEAFSFIRSDEVHKEEVEEGVAHISLGVFGVYTPDTDNPTEDTWWETIKYGKAKIPLTYPEGEEPVKNPSLEIVWDYDNITDMSESSNYHTTNPGVLAAEDWAIPWFDTINNGNIPLLPAVNYIYGNGEDYSHVAMPVLNPGESGDSFVSVDPVGSHIIPGTETEELLGIASVTFWMSGIDPETFEVLCESNKITRTWKVRKEGSVTPDPGQSQLKVTAEEAIWRPSDSRDPEGYKLGDLWGVVTNVENVGPVDIYDFVIHVDYAAANEWSHLFSADASDDLSWYEVSNQIRPSNDIAAGAKINFSSAGGNITKEDVARGYVYVLVSVKWVDPESGIERVDYAEPLIYPVISKTGLVLRKDIEHAPENGEYFREGEEIPWTLTVTNNSEESITNVTVTDEGVVVGTFAEIAAGDTVSCTVPPHTVTEYETIVGTVTNIATAVGTDLKGVDHTYMSNSVSVPTNDHSPTPLPPIGDPDTGGGGITEEPVPPVIPETPTTPDTPEGHFDPSMLPTGIPALEPVLGPDGMPILGPDGTPFLAPPGTTVVLDGDGNVLLSPFGTPVMMLPDGTYFTIGPDGRPILTDKDGNPILDANGNYIYIDFDTLYSCALNLEALGGAEAQYTLHACMDHKAAAEAAEAALNAGNGAEACRIWKEAIEELYGILYEAGDDGAKAALTEEKAAFEAFADSYAALAGSKAAAEMWRMKCARLCSIVHTLPENLPESLAGEYATILGGGRSYDETARVIGALYGYDSSMAEEYGPAEAETLQNVKEMLNIVSSWNYDIAFERGQQLWTMTLDRRVNAVYKAADPETRTKIAAWRVALDALAATEATVSGMLYPDEAAIPAEIVMNLFKDSVFDSVKLLNGGDEPADEAASKPEQFIARCYRYALGREASEAEIASWAAMVTDGGRKVEEIAHDILGSVEFQSRNLSNEETVKALYWIYFDREADAGGLANWVNALDAGESLENVEAGFAGSEEFKAIIGE